MRLARCACGTLLAVSGALLCQPTSFAQQPAPLLNFHQVDYFWSQNPQLFQNLWVAARSGTVRIAVLGDSQETSPGGRGSQFMPLLNYEMWKRYGNVPETTTQGCSSYGGGVPPADWLMRGACATPGPDPTRLVAAQILPNIAPAAISSLNGSVNLTHGYYGQLTMLQQDAIDVDPGAAIPSNADYFDTSGVIKARIFAATQPSSGEIAYRALPTGAHVPSYFSIPTTQGILTPGLQSAAYSVKSADTPALDFGGNRYMALEVSGSDDNLLTDIIGVRFYNETKPQGVIISSFSHGGYLAANFLGNHGSAGKMFQAFGFQVAVLHYGANDAGNNVTATQFQANLAAIIAALRTWVNDPGLPVILIADVYRDALTAVQMAEFDQYVGAEFAIAQADSNVLVINSRRLMEDVGWNASSGQSAQFLMDTVHYSARGAQVLAAAEVAALFEEVRVSSCMSDPASVHLPSNATLIVAIGGATACTGYGRYTVSQQLALNQAALNVVLTNGFTPSEGQSFELLSWGSLAGTFNSVTLPQLPAPLVWDTSQLYTMGTVAVTATPAPAISVLAGSDQTVVLPDAPAPLTFTVSGPDPLTVTAHSSNAALLPDSGISIDPACGAAVLTCTASLAVASGQTGAATVSLDVAAADGRSATTSATLHVTPAVSSGSGTGTGESTSAGSTGGAGRISRLLLSVLAGLVGLRASRARFGSNLTKG